MILHCPNVGIFSPKVSSFMGRRLPGLYLIKYFSNLYDVDTWKAYRLGVVHMPCHSVTSV